MMQLLELFPFVWNLLPSFVDHITSNFIINNALLIWHIKNSKPIGKKQALFQCVKEKEEERATEVNKRINSAYIST